MLSRFSTAGNRQISECDKSPHLRGLLPLQQGYPRNPRALRTQGATRTLGKSRAQLNALLEVYILLRSFCIRQRAFSVESSPSGLKRRPGPKERIRIVLSTLSRFFAMQREKAAADSPRYRIRTTAGTAVFALWTRLHDNKWR